MAKKKHERPPHGAVFDRLLEACDGEERSVALTATCQLLCDIIVGGAEDLCAARRVFEASVVANRTAIERLFATKGWRTGNG